MTKDEMIELGPEFEENYNRIRKMFPDENDIPYEVCLVSNRDLTEEEYYYPLTAACQKGWVLNDRTTSII